VFHSPSRCSANLAKTEKKYINSDLIDGLLERDNSNIVHNMQQTKYRYLDGFVFLQQFLKEERVPRSPAGAHIFVNAYKKSVSKIYTHDAF
jgi:hypothetical protein